MFSGEESDFDNVIRVCNIFFMFSLLIDIFGFSVGLIVIFSLSEFVICVFLFNLFLLEEIFFIINMYFFQINYVILLFS